MSGEKKKFLAKYIGSATANEKSEWAKAKTPEEINQLEMAGMNAWGQWMMDHQNVIVDQGGALGKTKRIDNEGITDVLNMDTGYVIIEAQSHEEAARLFLNHPHFAIFPGDSVEVMECLSVPVE